MKRFLTCLIATIPALAWSAVQNTDQDFFKHAVEGGIAEVEAGNLAQSKGHSAAVKDFGAMMVKDHTKANEKLRQIAAAENLELPGTEGVMHAASKTKLEVLKGETFDKAYIKDQVAAHERTLSLLKKEIATGNDSKAKAFAQETLPTVEAHLSKIRDIAAQTGIETK